jgi:hypothetical protein
MTHALVEPTGILLIGGAFADGSLQEPPRLIAWSEIVQVTLHEDMRYDHPIFCKHATWELATIDGEFATIQTREGRRKGLLGLLAAELPGFDRKEAERVFADGPGKLLRLAPVDGSTMVLWQRAIVRCPRCREADLVDAPEDLPFPEETEKARWWRRLTCPKCSARVPIGRLTFVDG